MSTPITTSIVDDSVIITITEGRTIRTEESEIIRIFHARYPSGADVTEIGVYQDGAVHASLATDLGKRCAAAVARRLGLNK